MKWQRSLYSGPASPSPRLAAPALERRVVPRPEPRRDSLAKAKLCSRGRRDAASGRQGTSWGRGETATPPARRSQGRLSGFFFFFHLFFFFLKSFLSSFSPR